MDYYFAVLCGGSGGMTKISGNDEKRNQEQSRNTGEVNVWLF